MPDELDRIIAHLARRNIRMTRRHLLRIMAATGVGISGLAGLVGASRLQPLTAAAQSSPPGRQAPGTPDQTNEWYQKTGPFPFPTAIWPYVIPAQIQAVDAKTLRFQLSQPDATFLDNLTWAGAGIISPPALKQAGRDFTLHPVGAGP